MKVSIDGMDFCDAVLVLRHDSAACTKFCLRVLELADANLGEWAGRVAQADQDDDEFGRSGFDALLAEAANDASPGNGWAAPEPSSFDLNRTRGCEAAAVFAHVHATRAVRLLEEGFLPSRSRLVLISEAIRLVKPGNAYWVGVVKECLGDE